MSPVTFVSLVASIIRDLLNVFATKIAIATFAAIAITALKNNDEKTALIAAGIAAVLWALQEINNNVAGLLRAKEYELDKPLQAILMLERKMEPRWREEVNSLRREAGLPDID